MFKVKILLVYYLFAGFASAWLLFRVITQGPAYFDQTFLKVFLILAFLEVLLTALMKFFRLAGAPAADENKSDAVA